MYHLVNFLQPELYLQEGQVRMLFLAICASFQKMAFFNCMDLMTSAASLN